MKPPATPTRLHPMSQLQPELVPLAQIGDEGLGLAAFRHNLGDLRPLMDSIWEYGLTSPPIVWKTVDRTGGKAAARVRYIVIAGNRRVAAIRELERKWNADVATMGERERKEATQRYATGLQFPLANLWCSVFEGSVRSARETSIELQLNRRLQADINRGDEAVAVAWLLDKEYKRLPEQIELMLGVSQPWVSELKAIVERLSPNAMEALRNGQIEMTEAYDLAKITRVGMPVEVELCDAALAERMQLKIG